jgi:glucose/arabinose dehydrogenase
MQRKIASGAGWLVMCVLAGLMNPAMAQQQPVEDDYFRLSRFEIPKGIVLEAGAIEPLPDGTLAVATRRGDIYMVTHAWDDDLKPAEFRLWAQGLHEILGLSYRDGWLYATQRCEVSRLRDTDADGLADEVQTFCDTWSINGDYHEYAFGSPFDKNGHMWVVLCLTGSFGSDCPWRGWAVRIDGDGRMIPTCSGIRSPGGIGFNAVGDVFYTDNQGPWNGTCSLKWLRPGSFQGHPGGNRWFSLTEQGSKGAPAEPQSGSRIVTEADRIPEYEPPAIMFPYQKMGQSASGIACDVTAGKFGPFKDQLFVGDVTHSTVMRCALEKVQGHYQGACFPFREGIGSGTLALRMTDDGTMFVGGTNRGWGSRGTKPFSLERLRWTGKVPFEILQMRAKPDGFELEFTEPVNAETAAKPETWKFSSFCYIFQSSYGSPEVDHQEPQVTSVKVSDDRRKVRLTLNQMTRGHIHELHVAGLKSAADLPLLHDSAWYTLHYLPQSE